MTSVPSAPINGRTINNHNDDSSKAPINEPITLTSGTTQQIPSHLAPASLRVSITSFALGILFGTTLYLSLYLFSFDSLKSAASNGWNLLGNDYDQEFIGNGFIKNVVGLVNQGKVGKASHWVWKPFEKPQFNFYLLSWSGFHMLEFVITARYNPTRLHVDCEYTRLRERKSGSASSASDLEFHSKRTGISRSFIGFLNSAICSMAGKDVGASWKSVAS